MTHERLLQRYRCMHRIRAVEEEVGRRYPEGRIRCPVHLSIGQEAVPALFADHVRSSDYAVSTHRGHAHYLAKGGNLAAMLAELYGKASGCSRGKGGSMHLIDLSVSFMGTSAIVGNSIPVGVGLALAAQQRGEERIACVFLGDGATEEGVFYEAASFAALRRLPVLFICENNRYSVYSPLAERQPAGRNIAAMVAALGVASLEGDGYDLAAASPLMDEAFSHVRGGAGPCFVEFATYRWREHCGHAFDNDIGYRSPEEFVAWEARDPLAKLRQQLTVEDDSAAAVAAIEEETAAEIAAAFAFAENAPFPDAAEAFRGEYA